MPQRYSVVATQYGQLSEAEVMALKTGTPAVLVREPTNKFDPNAVAVWIDGKRVGYVPKAQNRVLAAYIDQKGATVATVTAQDMAQDQAVAFQRQIPATFVRSPNSGFPQVEV